MSEYVVLIEGELGYRVLCPKKVAEDFLELIKDFNGEDEDYIYKDLSIVECDTIDEVVKYYDYVEEVADCDFFQKNEIDENGDSI